MNWRTLMAAIAILIVAGSIVYSEFLARKIAAEEKQKVAQWADAQQFIINAPASVNIAFATEIITEQKSIPVIETNENDSIVNFINLDSAEAINDTNYLKEKLKEFSRVHDPIVTEISKQPYRANKYYYGDSFLLKQIRYYPLVQLLIVALFIVVTITALNVQFRSQQNRVWAGMAKESAHQMGTPLSSMSAWIEMLKETPGDEKIIAEMQKDLDRLKLVSDRFSKIGSSPQLEEKDIIAQVNSMVDYMKRRAGGKVNFIVNTHHETQVSAMISVTLFDWVIENLLKNALDAMEGHGNINIEIMNEAASIIIDVKDSGKGISRANINKVFRAGFTTKKRGWGLGLTLCKRIIEQYHHGQLFVKWSEPGKGTTFRIVLNK
jgi:signal transduction histidine kinase